MRQRNKPDGQRLPRLTALASCRTTSEYNEVLGALYTERDEKCNMEVDAELAYFETQLYSGVDVTVPKELGVPGTDDKLS